MSIQKSDSQRDRREPAAGKAAVPLWVALLFGVFLFWALWYLGNHAADFDAQVYQPLRSPEQLAKAQPPVTTLSLFEKGRTLYTISCSPCHQLTGLGDPAKAPPLVGADWVLDPSPNRIGRILLDGFTGPVNINGQIWNLTMPAWKENLSDEQIAAVLSYVRKEWGNKASEIKPSQIKAIREETKGRPVQWTAEELGRIPAQ